ncbi:FAD:protein FMN transferase [Vagococcus bubulae]|uniref:FAD:protein FMN transferase n=1 Tax=Vagococcus bubulae TaxID=1977868 RepID=A0A429ZQ91_9ENTE|nr:FAD:protein FMN transferase [Vagococcus bubulae]RST95857.1 thiamine biosynthesis protein ApbE [Vagococcus bubulae]
MVKTHATQIRLMGTVIDIKVSAVNAKKIVRKTVDKLVYYEKMFSANREDSELMAINLAAGEHPVVVSNELFELIRIGKYHSCQKNSFLNIAIGPLVKSWKIGFSGAKVPLKTDIESLLAITNPEKIKLNDEKKSVYLEQKGMFIDLGALAKGYISDRIVDYYKRQQIESAILNLGGNVIVYGEAPHKDGYFRVGIQNPREPRSKCLAGVKAKNQSVVTSGIYERVLKVGDETYHHIINPKTGYPVETDVASLTIISHLSVDGEIWTTRLFGKNSQEIVDEVNQLPEIECIVIDKENQLYYSIGIQSNLI